MWFVVKISSNLSGKRAVEWQFDHFGITWNYCWDPTICHLSHQTHPKSYVWDLIFGDNHRIHRVHSYLLNSSACWKIKSNCSYIFQRYLWTKRSRIFEFLGIGNISRYWKIDYWWYLDRKSKKIVLVMRKTENKFDKIQSSRVLVIKHVRVFWFFGNEFLAASSDW